MVSQYYCLISCKRLIACPDERKYYSDNYVMRVRTKVILCTPGEGAVSFVVMKTFSLITERNPQSNPRHLFLLVFEDLVLMQSIAFNTFKDAD